MTTQPPNLKLMYGSRFQIKFDPGGKNDPWYYVIPCRYGHIYPYSDKLLAYYCVGSNIRAKLHREHPELEVRQWSDDGEAVFLFPPEMFDIVAEYARPRKRRKLSAAHRAKLAKSNRSHRFASEKHGTQLSSADRGAQFSENVTQRTGEANHDL